MTGIYSAGFGPAYTPAAKTETGAAPAATASNFALPIIAANQVAQIWGDPHITGANGGKFDFQNNGIFNLLSDQGVELNGLLTQKTGGKETYDTEAGLTVGDNKAHFYADGRVEIGSATKDMAQASLQDGSAYSLGDNATIQRNGDSYTVATPEYSVKVDTNQDDGNGQKHLNMNVSSQEQGVTADGVRPTGLLGETFNTSGNASGNTTQEPTTPQAKPQNATETYLRDSLFSGPKVSSSSHEDKKPTKDEAPAKVSTESASFIWQLADTNGDGKLDAAEIQAAARKLQDGNPQHQATAQLMMNMLKGSRNGSNSQPTFPDFNGDSGVSFDELSRLASLDGDDTSLSQADLNRLQSAPKGNSGSGALSMPQMVLQLIVQSLQVLTQLLQTGSLIR